MHKRLVKNCQVLQKPSLCTEVSSLLKGSAHTLVQNYKHKGGCETHFGQSLGCMDPRIRDTLQDTGPQRHLGWVFQQERSTDEGVLCELFRDHDSKLRHLTWRRVIMEPFLEKENLHKSNLKG